MKTAFKKGMLLSTVPNVNRRNANFFILGQKTTRALFTIYKISYNSIISRNYCSSFILEYKHSLSGRFTSKASLTTTGNTQKNFETLMPSKNNAQNTFKKSIKNTLFEQLISKNNLKTAWIQLTNQPKRMTPNIKNKILNKISKK